MFNGGFAFFELGSFSRFCVLTELQNFHEIKLPPLVGPESSRAAPPNWVQRHAGHAGHSQLITPFSPPSTVLSITRDFNRG